MIMRKQNREIGVGIKEVNYDKSVYLYVRFMCATKKGMQKMKKNNRIGNETMMYRGLHRNFINKKINEETKITVYKTIFRPILTFRSKSWETQK